MMKVVPFVFIGFKPRVRVTNWWRCLVERFNKVFSEVFFRPMNLTVLCPLATVNFVKLLRSFHSNVPQRFG